MHAILQFAELPWFSGGRDAIVQERSWVCQHQRVFTKPPCHEGQWPWPGREVGQLSVVVPVCYAWSSFRATGTHGFFFLSKGWGDGPGARLQGSLPRSILGSTRELWVTVLLLTVLRGLRREHLTAEWSALTVLSFSELLFALVVLTGCLFQTHLDAFALFDHQHGLAIYFLEHTKTIQLFGTSGWLYFIYFCYSKKQVKIRRLMLRAMLAERNSRQLLREAATLIS